MKERNQRPSSTGEKHGVFKRFARASCRATGHPPAFALALAAIIVWAILGPLFGFSDSWQLVINTATTIVTFLMVFLIQNTQNRDSEAMQLKLDELIRATKRAQNSLLDIEELSEVELDAIKARFEKLAQKARKAPQAAEATRPVENSQINSSEPVTERAPSSRGKANNGPIG